MSNTPDNPLISRFATRIHRLDIGGPRGGAGRTIDLLAPVDPDALLDDPTVAQRYKTDNYMPYWPIVWPSGLMLASKILTDPSSPPALPLVDSPSPLFADSPPRPLADSRSPPHCIELGCGLGLAGIAAGLPRLARHLHRLRPRSDSLRRPQCPPQRHPARPNPRPAHGLARAPRRTIRLDHRLRRPLRTPPPSPGPPSRLQTPRPRRHRLGRRSLADQPPKISPSPPSRKVSACKPSP